MAFFDLCRAFASKVSRQEISIASSNKGYVSQKTAQTRRLLFPNKIVIICLEVNVRCVAYNIAYLMYDIKYLIYKLTYLLSRVLNWAL